MSSMTLEELENRCEMLQRRVQERTPRGANRSPPRPRGGFDRSANMSSPGRSVVMHRDAAEQLSPRNEVSRAPAGAPTGLSKSDVSFALSSLERERARLEEQLRLVDIHIAAYHQLEGRPAAAQPPAAGPAVSHYPRADHDVSSASHAPVSPPPPRRSGANVSPTRPRSPPRGRSPPRASIQTEQIYEELRQIRRAREEREAQRRAAAGAASPTRL